MMIKQFLFVFTAILLDAVGCGSRNNELFLEARPQNVLLKNEQFASDKITVSSSSPWTATVSGEEFIELSPLSGNNNGTITVTALTKNESSSMRNAKVIITNNEREHQEVMVFQEGKTPYDK